MCAPNRPALNSALHDRFLALLPKIETHGQFVFRQLTPHHKEEVLQEMRALAWKWFVRLAHRGKDAADFISAFSGFLARAVRNGRRLIGKAKAKDVFSPAAQRQYSFGVQALPNTRTSLECLYSEVRGQQKQDALEERLRDNTATPVPDQAAFRVDWPAWLRTRCHRDRKIIERLAEGDQARDVGRRFGLSPARISQLRRAFKIDWEKFTCVAEDAEPASAT